MATQYALKPDYVITEAGFGRLRAEKFFNIKSSSNLSPDAAVLWQL